MNERIQSAETKQTRVIFPSTLNTQDSLFGGNIMKWMDEVAYITAVRYEREKMVTVSVEGIYSDEKEVVAQALFVFAPINEDHKPKALKSKN